MSITPQKILSEADLKALAIARLHRSRRITSDATIANEYRLGHSGVRADLAILDKKFIGVEIKSHRDSLRRLASQIRAYDLYFDHTILVVAERHLPNINIDLTHIELWSVSENGKIKTVSKCLQRASSASAKSLVDLLPARQRRRIQESEQGSIFNSLATEEFRKYFSSRFDATSKMFWSGCSNRELDNADMSSLSVYKPLRKKALARAQERASIFKGWGSAG